MTLHFQITHPGELAAGIRSYTERVSITVESGNPGGDAGEFFAFMRDSLADWFDGARVAEETTPEPEPETDYSGLYEHR